MELLFTCSFLLLILKMHSCTKARAQCHSSISILYTGLRLRDQIITNNHQFRYSIHTINYKLNLLTLDSHQVWLTRWSSAILYKQQQQQESKQILKKSYWFSPHVNICIPIARHVYEANKRLTVFQVSLGNRYIWWWFIWCQINHLTTIKWILIDWTS